MSVVAPTGMSMRGIRALFAEQWRRLPKSEIGGTVEIVGSSFLADEPTIFGAVNEEYVRRELEWYESESLKVADIPGGPPKIWQQVAGHNGQINSNYGALLFSPDNYRQYDRVLENLTKRPNGRQAVAIYMRPSMHVEWDFEGKKDFVCTWGVNYFLRDGAVHAVVMMRSQDAVFGYRNDYAWQKHVLDKLVADLNERGVGQTPPYEGIVPAIQAGAIVWQAASLHVYERHFHLIEHYDRTGEYDVSLSVGRS